MPHRRTDRTAELIDELMNELAGELTQADAQRLFSRLDSQVAPEPTLAETQALIDRLRPLVPRSRPRRIREHGLTREPLAQFIATQAHHFRPGWWLASLLFVLLGLALQGTLAEQGLSVTVMAPVLVIAGVAYALRSLKGAALELELSCPVTPTQVTLSRILVPLGYYLMLGALPALAGGASGQLLFSWTASLFLFTGLILTLTLYMGAGVASTLSLVVWGLLIALHTQGLSPFATAAALTMQVGILGAGLLLLLHALAPGRIYRLIEHGGR